MIKSTALVCAGFLSITIALFAAPALSGPMEDCQSVDPDRAIKGCTSVLKRTKISKKNKALAYGYRGNAYAEKGDYDSALPGLERCLALTPDDIACLSGKSMSLRYKGDKDGAIATSLKLMEAMEREPQSDELKAANIFLTLDLCDALVERSKERFAKAVSQVVDMALPPSADRSGVEHAIADLDICLRVFPESSKALGTKALYSYLLGRNDVAEANAKAAYEVDPNNAEALAMLAVTALQKNDRETSLKFSQLWQQIAPGNVNAEKQLSRAFRAVGRIEEADAFASLSTNRERCIAEVTAYTQGQPVNHDGGIEACGKVIETPGLANSSLLMPFEYRAILRAQKGDHDGAISDYTRCIEISGGKGRFAAFFGERGFALNNLAKYEQATSDFDTALIEIPDDPRSLAGRATAYAGLGQVEKARADFTRLQQISPTDAFAYSGLGDLARDAGDCDGAVRNYTKAIELDPGIAHPYASRARCFETLGKKQEATVDFRKALELDPTDTESIEALKRIEGKP